MTRAPQEREGREEGPAVIPPLRDEDLAMLEHMHASATRGEWWISEEDGDINASVTASNGPARLCEEVGSLNSDTDNCFVATVKNLVPAMIAELRAFRRQEVAASEPGAESRSKSRHCDDYIHDFSAPRCLRFFLLINRLPAIDGLLCREFGVRPQLFATHEGRRVRVVMTSRLGDVGITRRLDAEDGYDKRVMLAALTDFGDAP